MKDLFKALLILAIILVNLVWFPMSQESKMQSICEKEHTVTLMGQKYWCEPFEYIKGKHEQSTSVRR